MSQSSALLARGQSFLATEFPATIKIGPQSYAAATSGRRAQNALESGGLTSSLVVSFWLARAAFEAAGQPLPEARTVLLCTAPSDLAQGYLIEAVLLDGAGATVTLRCVDLPQ